MKISDGAFTGEVFMLLAICTVISPMLVQYMSLQTAMASGRP
jgi:hypothetical protein